MRKLNIIRQTFVIGFYFTAIFNLSAQDSPDMGQKTTNQDNFTPVNIIPPQEATVTINQDPKLKALLDIKSKMEKDGEFSDRYKIQLYYGNLKKANEIIKSARQDFEQWDSSLQWETPNYKVWIGNYRTRLEADRALKEIREKFPNAFIFKPEKKQ
ncbi:SPOR domain-containing protein [Aquimarina algicola]|uniref:SPOR domain-containing protein n=1 Tax=Aquimarina algicola TaxID=2589995 RepID=A0A504J6C2_9FLAO|nr:SPOR domain-containing protein [Aquimarina algicola]TPN86064.1 SPOR domain-containing protein [Aquimarina algicola]